MDQDNAAEPARAADVTERPEGGTPTVALPSSPSKIGAQVQQEPTGRPVTTPPYVPPAASVSQTSSESPYPRSWSASTPPPLHGGASMSAGGGASARYRREEYRERRQRHGAPILGPLLLIAAGIVLLLNSLDIAPWSIWGELWKLWPLILIAIGLDILFGRRSALLSLLIVLLVLAAGAVFLYTGGFLTYPGQLVSAPIAGSSSLTGATSANVQINVGVNELGVAGLNSEGNQLIGGTLEYYQNRAAPAQSFSMQGTTANVVLAESNGGGFFFNFWGASTPHWDVRLSRSVPVNLTVSTGTGTADLDLSNLKITSLNLHSGTGNATVRFPQQPVGTVQATVDGGVGNMDLTLSTTVDAQIRVDSGIGNINVDPRFKKQGDIYVSDGYGEAKNRLDLNIHMGVGNVNVSSR